MTFLTFFDCSGCGRISYYDCTGANVVKKNGYVYNNVPPVKCVGCNNTYILDGEYFVDIDTIKVSTQQKIQNTVRVPVGLYLNNLASLTVRGDAVKNMPTEQNNFVNQSQASDRANLSVQKQIANPRLRPGKLGPGGVGVDVKHNSFDRILARKKAQNVRTDSTAVSTPKYGNRVKKYGIVTQRDCACRPQFSLSFF
tara:strand:- start:81 stop:671 length:591 start_codon:yes stop_codon:yes gene_type:complete